MDSRVLHRRIGLVTAVAVVCGLFGCNDASEANRFGEPQPLVLLDVEHHYEKGTYPIQIVATTGMVADLVRRVGGDRVEVKQLMGAEVDPHLYKPTPGDVQALARADAVFFSGLHLEGKMTEYFEGLASEKPMVPVAEYLGDEHLIATSATTWDPHVWFDVRLWAQGATVVGEALTQFDPDHSSEYQANAEAYHKELMSLHDEVKKRLAEIPKEQRVMVTAHDAFQYFGKAYDVEVRGIQGISTESQAGLQEIDALIDFLVERKVKSVFVETSVSEKNVLALIRGVEAQGHEVSQAEDQLFSDAMGPDGTPEGTYVGMVRHNVDAIVNGLE